MKRLVEMFCGYQKLATGPNQSYCNKSCAGFHVSRRPGKTKVNKSSTDANTTTIGPAKVFISSSDPVWLESKRHISKSGYVDLYFWSKELKVRVSRREHIVIFAMVHQEEVQKGWCVHHRDENRSNNSPENLLSLPRGLHMELHRRLEQIARECCGMLYVVRRHEVTKGYVEKLREMIDRHKSWHEQ